MLIITSAQYIGAEFRSEFGAIPPSFLPVGNQRLYRHQLAQVDQSIRKILTLPEGYKLSNYDKSWLDDMQVEIVNIPVALSLRESLYFCLNAITDPSNHIRILHGDTLIDDIDYNCLDEIAIAYTDEYYQWAGIKEVGEKTLFTDHTDDRTAGMVVSGYFSFSSYELLKDSLANSQNFISALNYYSDQKPLKCQHYPKWFDLGHLHTYFRSKSKITTQRAFNDLDITPRVVNKSSRKKWKMEAEYRWFKDIPEDLSIYTPHVFGYTDKGHSSSYKIEYLYMSALNELAVFSALPGVSWQRILKACSEFLLAARNTSGPAEWISKVDGFHQQKTQRRLHELQHSGVFDIYQSWEINGKAVPSLADIATRCSNKIRPAEASDIKISHGDFCFSNILYDFRVQSVRVIDPRGSLDDSNFSPYGDARYDVAKLCHSLLGQYDFIVAEMYQLKRQGQVISFSLPDNHLFKRVAENFLTEQGCGYNEEEIIPMMINLFISMLPLHDDCTQRQTALLANALRLYSNYEELLA